MSDMLHELENNEAILLMYIAGELPEEERREVEQMLASQRAAVSPGTYGVSEAAAETGVSTATAEAGAFLALHDQLRSGWAGVMAGIERLDTAEEAEGHGGSELTAREFAARQVGRAVRQQHAGKMAAAARLRAGEEEASTAFTRRVPWWQTTAAAAAMLFLGFLVYWGWSDSSPPMAANEPATTVPTENVAENDGRSTPPVGPAGGSLESARWGRGGGSIGRWPGGQWDRGGSGAWGGWRGGDLRRRGEDRMANKGDGGPGMGSGQGGPGMGGGRGQGGIFSVDNGEKDGGDGTVYVVRADSFDPTGMASAATSDLEQQAESLEFLSGSMP